MRFPLAACLLVLAGCRQIVGIDDVGFADADTAGDTTVGFATARSTVDELSGTVAISVVLAAPTTKRVVVDYAFVDDTAQRGMDFTGDDGTLVFEPGDLERAIEVFLVEDETDEEDEQFAIRLTGATGAMLAADEHVVTVLATPFPRVDVVSADSSSDESAPLRVVLALDRPVPQPVMVSYRLSGTATFGTDYTRTSETLVEIPPNATMVEVVFQIIPDPLDEDDEQVVVTLTEATGAIIGVDVEHVHTIRDDDVEPAVSFVDSNAVTVEGATVTAVVRLSAASGREVRVDLVPSGTATYGVDFMYAGALPLVIPAGETQVPFPIQILDDGNAGEADESAVTSIAGIVNGRPGAPSSFDVIIRK